MGTDQQRHRLRYLCQATPSASISAAE